MDMTMSATPVSVPRQVTNFIAHFLEMCIAMCAVGTPIVLAVFRWVPDTLGFVSPAASAPELSLLLISLIYTAPMVAWMRFRGMPGRPVAEMALATVVAVMILIGLKVVGVVDADTFGSFVGPKFCGPGCAAMVIAMLPRLSLYTGGSGHHMHGSAAAA
jgi:hypothetical protein